MYVAPADRTLGEAEWRPFVEAQGFGHLVAPGAGLEYPVVVPTQFVLDGDEVLTHFAAPNPVLDALAANPRALLSVAGDWAFVPSDWKAIGVEDPSLRPPCLALRLVPDLHLCSGRWLRNRLKIW